MKFSKIILTMAALLTAGSAAAAGFDSRDIPVFTPGSTADVLIMADLPQGATALQFTATVPETFELVSENLILSSAAGVQSRVHKESDNTYNYVMYTADNSPIGSSDDYLFGLTIKAKPTSTGGTYELRFSNIIASTAAGVETHIADYSATLLFEMPVESISFNSVPAYLKIGESGRLEVTILPENATDKTVTWSSSDESIISIDANGYFTAVGVGIAEITAKCGEVSATCRIQVKAIEAESVTLSRSVASLKVGESVTLTATVLPETTTDKTVTWTSSNTAVATVDANGKVTAVALGEAVITAKCGEASATCAVKVVPTSAGSITLDKTSAELKATETVQLTATILPETTTDKTVTWKSSNESVATVDLTGKVTAIAVGKANISATAASGISATCEVTVIPTPAASVTLNRSDLSLKATETFKLEATVSPATTTDKTVTWTSSNEAVATVDANGNVTAVAVGDAVITAKCGEVSATCAVKVVPTSAGSITLDKTVAELKATETVQLTATILPETTTDKTVTWTSSNEAVATVDANGQVTAVAVGEAIITASCGNVSATCTVTVVPTPAESVTLSEHTLDMLEGAVTMLTAVVAPDDATYKDVIWTSSDEGVVTVGQDGTLTAVAEGTATIRVAMADDATVYDECRVTVSKETSGIAEIVAGDAPYEVYDLNGVKVGDSLKNLKPGFYIVRQGGTAKKLKIKN